MCLCLCRVCLCLNVSVRYSRTFQVFDRCSDEGDITPNTCPYLAEWFKW